MLQFFTINGGGGQVDHVNWTVLAPFCSSGTWRLHMKFDYNWSSSFRREVV